MTDSLTLGNPENKSFVEDTEQISIDSIEWWDNDDNICSQCGQDHSYKLKAGSIMLDIISFFDKNISREA